VAFAAQQPPQLYDGPLTGYDRPILDVPEDTALPERRASSSAPKAAAYSYLSVVGGVAMRHATWADCERRVKGQSGARFKKSASAADESAILRGWGIDPQSL
jgi:ribonuclease HI